MIPTHLTSEPKTIGMGPIMTAPALLTSPFAFHEVERTENATTANPAMISRIPTRVRSTVVS